MNNREAIETYQELAVILREFDLSWIVEQVEDHIRAGKAEQKRTAIRLIPEEAEHWKLEPPSAEKISRRRLRKEEEFTALRDFDAAERLELLIDATDRAVQGITNLESQLLMMEPFVGLKLVFAGEEAETSRSLDPESVQKRLEAARRLTKALAALRLELRNGD